MNVSTSDTPTGASQQPDDTNIPEFSAGTQSLLSGLNPFSGLSKSLPNAALIAVGVVLAIGALLISQKETVVTVATKAGELAA
jgi:hypothetical protein